MGRYLNIVFCFFITTTLWGQFGPQQIISTDSNPNYALPVDVDNDGYVDILTAHADPYNLAWYRHIDGQGTFGPEILISATPALYLSIDFVDLDGDNDYDILALINNPREVWWFENLDGLGNFAQEELLLNAQPEFVQSVVARDIDNDDDLDLIAKLTDTFSDRIVWLENTDGNGTFDVEQNILEGLQRAGMPIVVDMDQDGLLDILTSDEENGPARVIWFKNFGNVTFGPALEIYQFVFGSSDWTSIYYMNYVDINSDDKKDIALTANNDDFGIFYHWLENIDNAGTFGPIQDLPKYRIFGDVDGDGDNDIINGEQWVDRIYWIENSNGLGSYTIDRTVTTEVNFVFDVHLVDINGDGLKDITSASTGDDKIAWYPNSGLGINEFSISKFKLAPNPVQNYVTLSQPLSIASVRAYNTHGVSVVLPWEGQQIDTSKLPSGFYVLQIETNDGITHSFKLLKE